MRHIDLKGLHFDVRPLSSDEKAITEVVKRKVYARKEFQVVKGERWLDLGMNIGAFSCWAIAQGAQVVAAYEPEPNNAALAAHNLILNGFTVPIIQAAVIADQIAIDHVPLYLPTDDERQWRTSLFKAKNTRAVLVPTAHFGDILRETKPDAIKMDIEGAEIEILFGLRDFQNLRKLVFEYHFNVNKSIPLFLQIVSNLRKHFANVYHRKFLPGEMEYDHFPFATNVFCWND